MSTQPFRVNCYLCAFLTHWRPTPKRTCLTAACRAGRDSPWSPPCIASLGFGAVHKVRLGGQRGSVKQEPQPWAAPTEPAPAPQAGGPSEQLPVLPAPRPSSAVPSALGTGHQEWPGASRRMQVPWVTCAWTRGRDVPSLAGEGVLVRRGAFWTASAAGRGAQQGWDNFLSTHSLGGRAFGLKSMQSVRGDPHSQPPHTQGAAGLPCAPALLSTLVLGAPVAPGLALRAGTVPQLCSDPGLCKLQGLSSGHSAVGCLCHPKCFPPRMVAGHFSHLSLPPQGLTPLPSGCPLYIHDSYIGSLVHTGWGQSFTSPSRDLCPSPPAPPRLCEEMDGAARDPQLPTRAALVLEISLLQNKPQLLRGRCCDWKEGGSSPVRGEN